LENLICILYPGGYDGQSFLNIVEVYDPERDLWEEGHPLTNGRSGHACAVSYHQCVIHCENHDHSIGMDNPSVRGRSRSRSERMST
jgi:Kelch motif.